VSSVFEHLNGSDELLGGATDGDSLADSARRRVLGRLGRYAELVVGPLNLRPTAAALLFEDEQRVEVRVSTPSHHIVLVIAPNGDLAPEVFWLRALAASNLPIPRLIAHDLSCTTVPFTYAIESYTGGMPLDRLDDGPRLRMLARQVGRTLRRSHQAGAPGFGRPNTTGRWPAATWAEALNGCLTQHETLARAVEVLGTQGVAVLRAATLDHPTLAWEQPCAIHGAVEPARAIVTVGDTAQLEALTRPGALVGGDPLFDLAHGLLPRHPAPFRQGLLEGYSAAGALTPEQEQRLRRLGLLLHAADTLCRGDARGLAQLPDQVAAALRELG
jgi:hypothetical protein